MEVIRNITVKLTKSEYNLLTEAANLIDNITAEIDDDDFYEDYDLREASHNIYEFLNDYNVYINEGRD